MVNASAALVVAGLAPDYRTGATLAGQSIDSGRAMTVLEGYIRFSRRET